MSFRRPASALCSVFAVALTNAVSPAIASTSATVILSGGAEESLYDPATGKYDQTRDGTQGELRQDQSDTENRDVSVSIVDLRKTGLASLSTTGSATASIAGLRMSALVSGGAGAQNGLDGAFVAGSVQVGSSVYDEFVVLAPGLALGTLLELTASVYTDATVRNIGSATSGGGFETAASWRSTFSLTQPGTGVSAFQLMEQSCRFGTTVERICSGSGPATGELKLFVPNGATLALQITGTAKAYGQAGAAGPAGNAAVDAGADLGSTIAWAGITKLMDPGGNAITAFSAVSGASGFDYREGYVATVPPRLDITLLAAGTVCLKADRPLTASGGKWELESAPDHLDWRTVENAPWQPPAETQQGPTCVLPASGTRFFRLRWVPKPL